jgi:hypothetical protein
MPIPLETITPYLIACGYEEKTSLQIITVRQSILELKAKDKKHFEVLHLKVRLDTLFRAIEEEAFTNRSLLKTFTNDDLNTLALAIFITIGGDKVPWELCYA